MPFDAPPKSGSGLPGRRLVRLPDWRDRVERCATPIANATASCLAPLNRPVAPGFEVTPEAPSSASSRTSLPFGRGRGRGACPDPQGAAAS